MVVAAVLTLQLSLMDSGGLLVALLLFMWYGRVRDDSARRALGIAPRHLGTAVAAAWAWMVVEWTRGWLRCVVVAPEVQQ